LPLLASCQGYNRRFQTVQKAPTIHASSEFGGMPVRSGKDAVDRADLAQVAISGEANCSNSNLNHA
jgi:hypothetical protein